MKPQPVQLTLLETYLMLPEEKRQKLFMDTAQASLHTGIPRRTIQFWLSQGEIKAIKIGRRFFIQMDSLKACIEEKSIPRRKVKPIIKSF